MNGSISIRGIQPSDDAALANIIRNCLLEFGAAKPGTVFFDPTTDHLYDLFKKERSQYFVVTKDNEVLGGAGIFPTVNLPDGTCELVKLYLAPAARGLGLSKQLIERCMQAASENNFTRLYLESMPELTVAVPLYEKLGFRYLDRALGESGHTGCDIWMVKDLE